MWLNDDSSLELKWKLLLTSLLLVVIESSETSSTNFGEDELIESVKLIFVGYLTNLLWVESNASWFYKSL